MTTLSKKIKKLKTLIFEELLISYFNIIKRLVKHIGTIKIEKNYKLFEIKYLKIIK